MKIRTDFVTNSSSSSFIINKNILKPEQLELFYDMEKANKKAEELELCYYGDPDEWTLKDTGNTIIGYTTIDNFCWIKFLKKLNVDLNSFQYCNPGAGMLGLELIKDIDLNKANDLNP